MIKVNKDYYDVPEALTRVGCYRKIKRGIEGKTGQVYNGNHYKQTSVKRALHLIYNSKCAYCESKIEHAATLQVEHYRPKAGLDGYLPIQHKGYYWLGCEWSNLLLACPKCNGKSGKGTKFPIAGIRVFDGTVFTDINNISSFNRNSSIANLAPLIDEEPLLLNPEIDEPNEHLNFDSNGQIGYITRKGDETIQICKLDRDLLHKERRRVRDHLLEDIKTVAEGLFDNDLTAKVAKHILKSIFNKIKNRTNATEEYTLWGRYFYNNFEECFVQKLQTPYQNGIRRAFELYKRNQLLNDLLQDVD